MGQPISSIVIDIRADTANIRRDVSQLQSAVDSGFSRIENRARAGAESIEQVSRSFGRLNTVLGAVGGFLLAERAVGAVVDSLGRIPAMGLEFANGMETMQVGMAGTLASMATLDGKALSMKDALALSTKLTAQLADDAAKTAASAQELVNGFNAMLGPGLQAKMTIDQIRQLSTVGINAVKSLGLEGTQIVQEMRSILTGNITSDSQLAVALGITNKDIAKIKQSGGSLFDYLMQRLQGFAESSDYYSKTMAGLIDSSKELVSKAAADGIEPLRAAAKDWLSEFNDALNDDGQRRHFVDGMREVSGGLVEVAQFSGRAGRALYEYRDAIMLVVGAYAALKAAQLAGSVGAAVGQKVAAPVRDAIDWRSRSQEDEAAAGAATRRAQADRVAAMAELDLARATTTRAGQTAAALAVDRQKLALDAALAQGAVRQIEQSGSLAVAKAMVAEADAAARVAATELAAAEQARGAQTVGSVAAYERLQVAQVASVRATADLAAAKAIEAAEQDRLSQAQSRALAMSNALAEADTRLAAAEVAATEASTAQTAATGRAALAAEAAAAAQRQHVVALAEASVAARAAAAGVGIARGALALLGGPIGVAALAIGGLIMYWDDLSAAAGNAAATNEQAAKRIKAALADRNVSALRQEQQDAQREYQALNDRYDKMGRGMEEGTRRALLEKLDAARGRMLQAGAALQQGLKQQQDDALKAIDKYTGEKRDSALGHQVVKPKFNNALQNYLEEGKHQTKDEKYKQAVEEENAAFRGAVDGLEQGSAEYQKALAAHNSRIAEMREEHNKGSDTAAKKAAKEAARDMEQVSDLINKSAGISPTYNNKLAVLQKVFGQGKISLDQYRAAVEKLIATETDLGKESDKLAKRQREVLSGLSAQAQEQAEANARESIGLGRGDRYRQESAALDQLGKRAVEAKRRLAEDLDLKLIDPVAYQRALDAIDASTGQMVANQQMHFAAMRQAAGDWSLGAGRALENYIDHARDVAGQTEEMFSRAFGGMEDGLTKFVMTGKLSFADLANSIIEDLIRIQIRQSMVGMMGGGMGGMLSGLFQSSGSAAPIVNGAAGYSTGGPVLGPGTPTSDSIPAMLSNGEFVVRAAAVDHYGLGTLHALNAKRLASGGGVGRASSTAGSYSVPETVRQQQSAAPASIRVELINKSGQQLQATSAQPRFDGREMVVSVVLEDIKRGGPIRDAIKRI
ncbi:phage tail tape measure protein [Chromobacterium subtsugae]|uniref:phage tail tape measure protein n=1 Tax=Chromobacterium subtsugae TaxID=251747 RepID=UPI000640E280|nr:phage tail tape measure protein [Chromobacterium subtsugae]